MVQSNQKVALQEDHGLLRSIGDQLERYGNLRAIYARRTKYGSLQQQMMFEAMQSPLGPEPDTIPMLPPPPPLISIHN